MEMRKVLFFLIGLIPLIDLSAQSVDKHGKIVTDVRFFTDRYGVIGSQTAIDRYGSEVIFANLSTIAVTELSSTSASSGGYIVRFAGPVVSSRGICWSTSSIPTTSDSVLLNGNSTDTFTGLMTGLRESTTYYVRAFAVNTGGTTYGNTLSFMY